MGGGKALILAQFGNLTVLQVSYHVSCMAILIFKYVYILWIKLLFIIDAWNDIH